jgi:hypothetical protein
MSRNKIEMSTRIFDQIIEAAQRADPNFRVARNSRWIKKKDDADLGLMTNAKIVQLSLGGDTFAASLRHSSNLFFGISMFPEPTEDCTNFNRIDPTPGLFASFVCATNLRSVATSAQARNILEDQYQGFGSYGGHELDLVASLFPRIQFYEVSLHENNPYLQKLESMAGAFVARSYPGTPLALSTETLRRIAMLFESGVEDIPYDLVLQGFLSSRFENFFLELYRCIEQLYAFPLLTKLKTTLNHSSPIATLAQHLEEVISWRPAENQALAGLLAEVEDATRKIIISAFCPKGATIPESTAVNCAKRIYALRNSLVHFRPGLKPSEFDVESWNKIISVMIDIIEEVYARSGAAFFRL